MTGLNETQRYFVEEFAEEYHQGHMERRELLRRVLLITGGVASAASTLLALGCGGDSSGGGSSAAAPTAAAPASSPNSTARPDTATATATPPASASPAASASPSGTAQARGAGTMPPTANTPDPLVREDDPAIRAEMVQYRGPAGTVFAYLARPRTASAAPGIIVVHENMGLREPNMDIARRYAKEGFAALAVDLVSREGGTEKYANDAPMVPAILGRIPQSDLAADLVAGIAYLKTAEGVRREGFGVTGFCFGGGMTFALAVASPDIRVAVPYYGNAPLTDLPRAQAAFLIFYGETDTRITAQAPAVEAALRAAGRTVETKIEPGAGHAFFRNGGGSYNAAAARDAWPRTLEWFSRYL